MVNRGIIQEINGNKIKIKLFKSSSCSHCSCCSEQAKYGKDFEFSTNKNAHIGDLVTLEISEKDVIKAASIAYLMPPILMIIGYFVGQYFELEEIFRVLTSFIFLGLAFILLFLYDKFFAKKSIEEEIKIISIEKFDPTMVEMMESCEI